MPSQKRCDPPAQRRLKANLLFESRQSIADEIVANVAKARLQTRGWRAAPDAAARANSIAVVATSISLKSE